MEVEIKNELTRKLMKDEEGLYNCKYAKLAAFGHKPSMVYVRCTKKHNVASLKVCTKCKKTLNKVG